MLHLNDIVSDDKDDYDFNFNNTKWTGMALNIIFKRGNNFSMDFGGLGWFNNFILSIIVILYLNFGRHVFLQVPKNKKYILKKINKN